MAGRIEHPPDQPLRHAPNDLALHVRQAVESSKRSVGFLACELCSKPVEVGEPWCCRTRSEICLQAHEFVLDDTLSLCDGDGWQTGCRAAAGLEIVQIEELDPRKITSGRLDVSGHGQVQNHELGPATICDRCKVFGPNEGVLRTGGDE